MVFYDTLLARLSAYKVEVVLAHLLSHFKHQHMLKCIVAMFGLNLAGLSLMDGALDRCFCFADFHRTMAFVNAVAWIAQQENHGPDLFVSWTSCRVCFNTHDVKGLSLNDFICAAKVNALCA